MAIKVRRGTDIERLSVILEQGEIAYTTDTKKFYVGDGITYGGNEVGGSNTLASLTDVDITSPLVGDLLHYNGTQWQNFTPDYFTLPSGGTTSEYIDGTGALQTFPTLAQADRLITEVRNETGSTVAAGTVVYLNGAAGNKPLIALAEANAEATSTGTYGVVRSAINNNQNGYVVVIGTVSNLNTSAYTAGDILWLSPTVPGGFTTTKPSAPNHAVYVAIVTRSHATQGTIEVKIQNGYELNELHNVSITSPSDKQVLYYDSATLLWKNASVPDILYGQNISVGTIEGNSGISQMKFNTGAGSATPTLAVGNTDTGGKFAALLAGTAGSEFNFDKSGWFAIAGDTKANYNSNSLGSGSETYYLSVFGSTGNINIGGSNTDTGYKLNVAGSFRATSVVVNGGTSGQFLKADGSLDSSIYVPTSRTLSINGTTYDLLANRSWSVGDLLSTGSYANPTWLTSLAWGKISGTPTTLSGYGITDAVPSSRILTINGTAYDLSADRSWTISTATPTLAQVTTAGNTTTNSISVGGLTVKTNLLYTDTVNNRVGIGTASPTNLLTINANVGGTEGIFVKNSSTQVGARTILRLINDNGNVGQFSIWGSGDTLANKTFFESTKDFIIGVDAGVSSGGTSKFQIYVNGYNFATSPQFTLFSTGNLALGTTTDAGYKLDVNGTARVQNTLTVTNPATDSTKVIDIQSGKFFVQANGFIQLNNIAINGGSSQLRSISGLDLDLQSASSKSILLQNIAYTPAASGTQIAINFTPSFTTTAANALFNGFVVAPTINQTGSANGITRGIYVNPTLTAAVDFRAIDVAGGKIVSTASITASSSLAQGVYFNNTLVAAANNDVLVGLDINPTFTNGAFTGVGNYALRTVQGDVYFASTSGNIGIGMAPVSAHKLTVSGNIRISSGVLQVDRNLLPHIAMNSSGANYGLIQNQSSTSWSLAYGSANNALGTAVLTWFGATGNVGINTTTDAGYKLDVNGTVRIKGTGTTSATTSFSVQNSAGNYALNITDDRYLSIYGLTAQTILGSNNASLTLAVNNFDFVISGGIGNNGLGALAITNAGINANFGGIKSLVSIGGSWTTTSAVGGVLNALLINTTINQSGAATGVTRGIHINQTITSAANYRGLEVSSGLVLTNSSITASSSLAQGVYFNNTLVAAANNDVLVGLDISPTYTKGAFTGVVGYGLRITSPNSTDTALRLVATEAIYAYNASTRVSFNIDGTYGQIYNVRGLFYIDQAANSDMIFRTNAGSERMRIFAGGDIGIGTATDVGYKLDVNGTIRATTYLRVNNGGNPDFYTDATGGYTRVYLNNRQNLDGSLGLGNANFYSTLDDINLYINRPSTANIQFREANSSTAQVKIHTGGNVSLNSNIDYGYLLDVNGTARVQNSLMLGNLASDPTGSNGMIYYNTTTNKFRGYENGAWANLI